MKKNILLLAAFLPFLLMQGCLKNKNECIAKTVQSEEGAMQAYANNIGMAYIRHPSGLYYQITNQGSGPAVTSNSRVSVTYTGKLLDGTVFDQATTPTAVYPVSGFILGWQYGLPFLNKGGTIRLIIPSSLAYGCVGAGTIPANAVLYFDVQVVDVQ